ncbi:hypothetical protein GALMADRAFT_251981 [Galerina marginata CBS 339.88]|uniref:F-box domain-containing protein n=1 Tax=Galerina marginata (strain CBS 339.88) TaxID=685588 RepID=A0A067T2W0_GALM3|nr:hypothetical protein GALMADRAFT_251981 [Galerina marginata CBS 339.88]
MFLDLPLEVIVYILLHLNPQDLFACQLTAKYLNNIVRESVVVRYASALSAAKAENNMESNLPISEKLRELDAAEKSWAFVRPGFSKSVEVSETPCGVYDLTGGVYFLCNSTRTVLHCLKLPRKEGDELSWRMIESKKQIIDIGLCLYEHDLLVLVTTTPHRESIHEPMRHKIELEFLQFSTGEPHPQGRESCIHVMVCETELPSIGIEIVGDDLALTLSFSNELELNGRVFIYEWQTNILKASFLAPRNCYADILFLTENVVLLPNKDIGTLDIYRIPSTPTVASPIPCLTLCLPRLEFDHSLSGISSRAEPNPIGAASYARKKRQARNVDVDVGADRASDQERAFIPSAEDAMCVFDLYVEGLGFELDAAAGALFETRQPRQRLTFLVHRSAFVSLVDKYANSGIEEEEQKRNEKLSWADWGPPITRWFTSDGVSNHWITSSTGQRYARMEEDLIGSGVPLCVMDFNQANVRRMKKYLAKEIDGNEQSAEMDENDDIEPAVDQGQGVMQGERPNEAGSPSGSSATSALDPIGDLPPAQTPSQDHSEPTAATINSLTQQLFGGDHDFHLAPDEGDEDWETESTSSDNSMTFRTRWCPPSRFGHNRIWTSSEMEQLQTDVFSERVEGGLPYVGCASEELYTFDGVLLDEERVIGLKLGDSHRVESVDILYFG